MSSKRLFLCISCLLLSALSGLAFNGQKVSSPPLTLEIGEIPLVTNRLAPELVSVTVSNTATTNLPVQLQLHGLVDGGRPEGPARHQLMIPAKGTITTNFLFVVGTNTYSGLYPVKITAVFSDQGQDRRLEAVQIFQTSFAEEARGKSSSRKASEDPLASWPLNVIQDGGTLALATLNTHRVTWRYIDQPLHTLPTGWQGSEPTSRAYFAHDSIARGETRPCLVMHPPYQPGPGTVFAEYRLRLPRTTPIQLHFYNAIRDSSPKEGISDGVTFRVWAGEKVLFERHTISKVWLPGTVDLSPFAGKEIQLRLESHPGPKNNTVCDSSFWGDPVIISGSAPKTLTAAQKSVQHATALRAIADPAAAGKQSFIFNLAGGTRAVFVPGPNGLFDAAIAFGAGDRAVVFDGFNVALWDQTAGKPGSAAAVDGVRIVRDGASRVRLIHQVRTSGEKAEVVAVLAADGAALRLKLTSAGRITDLSLGPASEVASRVYYGHGYCIVDPGPFRAGGGGHDLATSHVGFEFGNGLALLTACDQPPDSFEVNPARRIYALHTHPGATFTFVPGLAGALDCAVRYRPLYDKKAAPAVARKAGRFVFDYWGGSYAENTHWLQRCFDYGLTNSLAIIHVWQRWGYDYRLPDIFPPMPSLGTLQELRALGDTCTRAGALWGLHDNYIDIYPDCEGFSYDLVTFHADGQPRKAWFNEGRKAQSYQFRPDRVRPFLKRNLDLIEPALKPTASFVDVWTSINAFDYYDRHGQFHSKTETHQDWGEAFQLIRDTLSNAPTTSEAGSDHLIGWLDGADAQFLRLSTNREPFTLNVACRDWERVPWFDAVNHARFSLHGVGYGGRYQGGLPADTHGIQSDDYISAEILTGHALMTDRTCGVRGAVRKYWLAQDFIQSIALDEIVAAGGVDADIHRVQVRWKSGAEVWVNRGTSDWVVLGRTLPPNGYLARNGQIESCIERIDGRVVERARAAGSFYCNAREAADTNAVEFGPAKTAGAFRLLQVSGAAQETPVEQNEPSGQKSRSHLLLIPLPDSSPFEVRLDPPTRGAASTAKVHAVDAAGMVGDEIPAAQKEGRIVFSTRRNDFGYRID